MPDYTVSLIVSYTSFGVIMIKAKDEHEARKKAESHDGLNTLKIEQTDIEIVSIECADDAEDEYDEYKYTPETHLATPAPEARITMPCPEPLCKGTLEIRTNRKNGSEFLGCNHYPECRHTQPLTEYLKLKKLGAPTLF